MRRLLATVMGLFTGANGITMMVAPAAWFSRVPGADATGPFNPHLVLDVGMAFVVAGGALAVVAWRRRLWPAALTGAAFLALHATLHVWEMANGQRDHVLVDVALVVVPAVVAVAVAWPTQEDQDVHENRSMVSGAVQRPLSL